MYLWVGMSPSYAPSSYPVRFALLFPLKLSLTFHRTPPCFIPHLLMCGHNSLLRRRGNHSLPSVPLEETRLANFFPFFFRFVMPSATMFFDGIYPSSLPTCAFPTDFSWAGSTTPFFEPLARMASSAEEISPALRAMKRPLFELFPHLSPCNFNSKTVLQSIAPADAL